MMHGTYVDTNGVVCDYDLDALKVVAQGSSLINRGWSGLLAFYPQGNVLIELRSSPPNPRGDSKGEASEVDDQYAMDAYHVTAEMLNKIRAK